MSDLEELQADIHKARQAAIMLVEIMMDIEANLDVPVFNEVIDEALHGLEKRAERLNGELRRKIDKDLVNEYMASR